MGPLRQQPRIHFLEQRTKAIGIVNQVLLAMPNDSQLITEEIFTARQNTAKETACVYALQLANFTPGFRFNNPNFGRVGQQRPDFQSRLRSVHP